MIRRLSKEEFMSMYYKDIECKKKNIKEKNRDIDNYMFETIERYKRKSKKGRYRMSGGD